VSHLARLTLRTIVALGLLSAAPTGGHAQRAQSQGENLSAGKTPAQLFASDCAACHRSPAGLAKGRGPGQIANFLIEHYTSSRQSAGLLGSYVASIRGSAPAATPRAAPAVGERPTAAVGPRPSGEVEAEPPTGPVLLQEERAGAGNRQRPGTAATRGRGQPAQAAHRPEAAPEPEARVEPAPAAPVPKTLDTLEVYD
jgi:hypothetical protein